MTTAHRPTWNPALASKDQGGNRKIAPSFQFSAKDLPAHKVLKVRQPGQNTLEEISRRNLKEELFAKELLAKRKRLEDSNDCIEEESVPKKAKLLEIDYTLDADDSDGDSSEDEDDSDSDSDSSEDEDEIRRELAKIKAERAAQLLLKQSENEEAEQLSQHEKVLKENPLLWQEQQKANGDDASYALGPKWYDDVIFKNQARDQPKHKKRFINDTVRNDFHLKFLNKYVQ